MANLNWGAASEFRNRHAMANLFGIGFRFLKERSSSRVRVTLGHYRHPNNLQMLLSVCKIPFAAASFGLRFGRCESSETRVGLGLVSGWF